MSIITMSLEKDRVERYVFVEGVFSREECQEIVRIGNTKVLEPALTTELGAENKASDYRQSSITFFDTIDCPWMVNRLVELTNDVNEGYFKFDVWGYAERFQFAEYTTGQYYKTHIDKMYGGAIRKLSMVLQLTDPTEYDGGDVQLLETEDPVTLNRSQGTVLFFPAYTPHRVTNITRGKRNSVVGWTTGKPFK